MMDRESIHKIYQAAIEVKRAKKALATNLSQEATDYIVTAKANFRHLVTEDVVLELLKIIRKYEGMLS